MVYIHEIKISVLNRQLNDENSRYLVRTFLSFKLLQAKINRTLPLLVFGICSIISGIMSLMLPETRGEPLKQTVEEGEMFVERNLCKSFPWLVSSRIFCMGHHFFCQGPC